MVHAFYWRDRVEFVSTTAPGSQTSLSDDLHLRRFVVRAKGHGGTCMHSPDCTQSSLRVIMPNLGLRLCP